MVAQDCVCSAPRVEGNQPAHGLRRVPVPGITCLHRSSAKGPLQQAIQCHEFIPCPTLGVPGPTRCPVSYTPQPCPSWMACAFITQRSRHPRLERFRDLGASGKDGPELRQSLLCPGCMASEQLFYQPLAQNPAPDPGRAKGRRVQRLPRGRGPGPGLPRWPCRLPQLPGLLQSGCLS